MLISDALQEQAKALGNPSRFRLFSHIAAASSPVVVAEMAELLGFNHNAIRQHLVVLVGAGLVLESDEVRTTRGRPRKHYELRTDALSTFASVAGSYRSLADLLLDLATTGDSPYDVGRRCGAATPIELSDDDATMRRQLHHRLALDGFEPTVLASGTIVLDRCPFADVAAKDPDVVCELHRGLVDGYLSRQPQALTTELRLRPPHRGGCQVIVNHSS